MYVRVRVRVCNVYFVGASRDMDMLRMYGVCAEYVYIYLPMADMGLI